VENPIKKEVIIGDCRLLLGDCLEIMPLIEDYDCIISDPPYELRNNFGESKLFGTRVMEFHFDIPGVTKNVVVPVLSLALKNKNVKSFHIFCGFEQFGNISEVAFSNKFKAKPWLKKKLCPPAALPKNWWPNAVELAIYGYRTGAYFGDNNTKRTNLMEFDSYRNGIRKWEKIEHPTQKFLPMISYIVDSICDPKYISIDPFMGSGTTGVACALAGRKFTGIEKEEKYFDIACKRIEEAYKQPDLFVEQPTSLIGPKQEKLL